MNLTGCKEICNFSLEPTAKRLVDQFFLPIRHGGLGIISAERTTPSAYIGSWSLCANYIAKIAPSLQDRSLDPRWTAFSEFNVLLREAKKLPYMDIDEITVISIWKEQFLKIQSKVNGAIAKATEDRVMDALPRGGPSGGYNVDGGMNQTEKSLRCQGFVNKEKTASAWLTANPGYHGTRIK